jgi:hypothetical protein
MHEHLTHTAGEHFIALDAVVLARPRESEGLSDWPGRHIDLSSRNERGRDLIAIKVNDALLYWSQSVNCTICH